MDLKPIEAFKLFDENDDYFLQLKEDEKYNLPRVLSNYSFKTPELATESIISFSYDNIAFAAKVFLNVDLLPYQIATLEIMFDKQFPMIICSRGYAKSFSLALFSILKALLFPNTRVVVISASFRQAKTVFNYINDIYKKSPVLQQICGRGNHPKFDISACYFQIGTSKITCLPLGDGERIRGERGNVILTDEFGSINEEIFQVVVRGFGAVSQDPISKVKEKYRLEHLEKTGVDTRNLRTSTNNQIILSGTARYQFNHFYRWYKKYLNIISCRNDKKKLKSIMGDEVTDEELGSIDTNEFCVVQVPYNYVPILDESMLSQARATMTEAQFQMEYGAKFWADSDGFIPMSLLHAVSMQRPYIPSLIGENDKKYIMGVDPARKKDHFALVVIELDESEAHQHKIVYCWATNIKKMKKSKEVNENQLYYNTCAEKIRQMISRFNIVQIMIDSGGGGDAIAEILSDKTKCKNGERPIWEIDNPDHRMYEGDHLIKLINFNSKWIAEANHSLRKSIEDFRLLFPSFNGEEIEKDMKENPQLYSENYIDKITNKTRNFMTDSLEDVSFEIESLKEEISSIVITQTQGGNEHFDLPKLEGAKKDNDTRRKDRYSACLLAHWGIQDIVINDNSSNYKNYGGTAKSLAGGNISAPMYRGLPAGTRYNSGSSLNVVTKRTGGNIIY